MSLRDDLIKHRIFINRFARTEANNIKEFLNLLKEQAKLMIKTQMPDHLIKASLRSLVAKLPEISMQNLADFAEYESKFNVKTINKYSDEQLTAVGVAALATAIKTSVKINQREGTQGKTLDTAYKQFSQRKADEISQIIRDSRIANREDAAQAVVERVEGLQRLQANSLASMSVNYVATLALMVTLGEAAPLMWVSALEVTTCDYCRSNHEKPVKEVGFEPPAHWGCLCHVEPIL